MTSRATDPVELAGIRYDARARDLVALDTNRRAVRAARRQAQRALSAAPVGRSARYLRQKRMVAPLVRVPDCGWLKAG